MLYTSQCIHEKCSYDSLIEMPRKGRFYQNKYFEASKRVKSIPASFKISVLINYYHKQPLKNLDEVERIYNLGLPQQWTQVHTDKAVAGLVYTTMLHSSLLSLKKDDSLGASLKFDGYEAQLPPNIIENTHLNSAYKLHNCMSIIKEGSVCKGNRVQEFDTTIIDFTNIPITFRMGKHITLINSAYIPIFYLIAQDMHSITRVNYFSYLQDIK